MLYRKTEPHEGFKILQKWCQGTRKGHFVYTSNVDNQFQKSGFDENRIVECHGTLFWMQSLHDNGKIWPCPNNFSIEIDHTTFKGNPLPKGPPGLLIIHN